MGMALECCWNDIGIAQEGLCNGTGVTLEWPWSGMEVVLECH